MSKIEINNIYKIFGTNPDSVMDMVKNGSTKAEVLEQTGHTVGLDNVSLNIRNSGGYNANANTFVIDPPTRGEFTFTGGPASTTYMVTTPVSTTLGGPGPAVFIMDNFRVRPNTLITDASGTDTFRIMARIRSTSGDSFGDGDYDDTFNITVNF